MQHGLILGGGRGIAAGYMAETTGSTETRSGVSFADACVCCRQQPLVVEVAESAAFAAVALADEAVAQENAYSFQAAASAALVFVATLLLARRLLVRVLRTNLCISFRRLL